MKGHRSHLRRKKSSKVKRQYNGKIDVSPRGRAANQEVAAVRRRIASSKKAAFPNENRYN